MRYTIVVLRPVCRAYGVASVARLRRLHGGAPKWVAAWVLHAALGMRLPEIASVLRTTLEDVCQFHRFVAVRLYQNRRFYEEVRSVCRRAEAAIEDEQTREEWYPF